MKGLVKGYTSGSKRLFIKVRYEVLSMRMNVKVVFDTIGYLSEGNPQQREAYRVLAQYGVMEKLHTFDPILVGTIPIQIDTPHSDLDIICYTLDNNRLVDCLQTSLGGEKNFRIRQSYAQGMEVVIANFELEGFAIEIFGQNISSKHQLGYRHMLVEHRLIVKYGEAFRQQIVDLKLQGYKTEPAFAHLLNLGDDPYTRLLDFENQSLPMFGIKKARVQDLDAIRAMFYGTIHTVNAKDYTKIQLETWSASAQNIDKWEQRLILQDFYVAHFQQQIVGFASLGSQGYIDLMYVHKDFQQLGIAKLLLQTIEDQAKELGEATVWADVSITAVPFFKSQGFHVEKIYAKQVGGVVFENTIMRKLLKY